jgi:hypothetical protein
VDYHLAGLISASFVTLSMSGIALQLRQVLQRKRRYRQGVLAQGEVTASMSLNRFFASYYGFYAMLLYGMSLGQFNHYLVWPRVIAVALLTWILFEIRQDRRSTAAKRCFILITLLNVAALALPFTPLRVDVHDLWLSHLILLSALTVFIQGASHQVWLIRKTHTTGALSFPMHALFAVKDVASLSFAISMGLNEGWPVLVFHLGSLIFQCIIMYHFHWIRSR